MEGLVSCFLSFCLYKTVIPCSKVLVLGGLLFFFSILKRIVKHPSFVMDCNVIQFSLENLNTG